MKENILIRQAIIDDAADIAGMVGELLSEIMEAIGYQAFNYNIMETTNLLSDLFRQEKYFIFIAREEDQKPVGFIALSESCSLYAGGFFGTIPEFYVRREYRSKGVGQRLASKAKSFGSMKRWKRLEVATPPLPQFEKTLAFYEREGFVVSGGRKLKADL